MNNNYNTINHYKHACFIAARFKVLIFDTFQPLDFHILHSYKYVQLQLHAY